MTKLDKLKYLKMSKVKLKSSWFISLLLYLFLILIFAHLSIVDKSLYLYFFFTFDKYIGNISAKIFAA